MCAAQANTPAIKLPTTGSVIPGLPTSSAPGTGREAAVIPRPAGSSSTAAPVPGNTSSGLPIAAGVYSAFEASLEFFLGPLIPYLRDAEVTEVMVNGPSDIYVERGGRVARVAARFSCEADVQAAATNIAQFVGQPISMERPLMDGRLPDGSRVCVVLGGIAARGTQINIRRFPKASGTPQFLLERDALTPQAMEFLLLAVRARCNIMVSGGAGSGKTTLVNVLSTAFDPSERIIVIEDTRELQIQREHVVQMEARPPDVYGRGQITIRDLFATSLRMRPDRIIVGEVRRGEALDLIQAMTSGHGGALATVHASSPYDACHRLETLAMMADVGIPLYALRRQVASAIDLFVQTDRLSSGRRLISRIAELSMDEASQSYILRDIFHLASAGAQQHLAWTGAQSASLELAAAQGFAGQMELTGSMVAKSDVRTVLR